MPEFAGVTTQGGSRAIALPKQSMRFSFWWSGLMVAIGSVSQPVHAGSIDEDFASGVSAYRTGDFETARRYFVQARDAGLDTGALHCNLGSTYYRLTRYDEARSAFTDCARDPAWSMLARYNIGLVAWQQGDRAAAVRFFAEVSRQAENPKLAALALAMEERIDPRARLTPHSRVAWSLGYDSNVVLTDLSQLAPASGKSDVFSELSATTGARFGRRATSPRWEASLYDLRYSDLEEFNLSIVGLGVSMPVVAGRWVSYGGIQGKRLWLGGSTFQQVGSLSGGTDVDLGGGRLMQVDVRVSRIDALDNRYQFLDGNEIDLVAGMSWASASRLYSAGAIVNRNDREDLVSGSDFYSYSPTRLGLWARSTWTLRGRWTLQPSIRFRNSQYADADRHGGLNQKREDNDWQVGLLARYRLVGFWMMTAEYQYLRNHSNFDEFAYTRHVVQAGVQRRF